MKPKRILKKLLVKEITLVTDKMQVQNNKPLLLLKAKGVGEMQDLKNNQTLPEQLQPKDVPAVPQIQPESEPVVDNEARLRQLEAEEGKPNESQEKALEERLTEVEAKLKEKDILLQEKQDREQPAQGLSTIPLQTEAAAEVAGIKVEPESPQQPTSQQSQQIQPTTVPTEPQAQTKPKKSADIFLTNEGEKTKKVQGIYDEYKSDATKNPWKMVEEVSKL